MKRVLAGDQAAEHRFVEAHYPVVHRLLVALSRSFDDADELTQVTFLKARASLSTFRGDCGLKTWLRQIAYNEFRLSVRGAVRKTVGLTEDLAAPNTMSTEAIVLWDAIEALSEEMKDAFVLREVDRLSVGEIAVVLGVPEGTVKSRCHHAKLALRKSLASAWPEKTKKLEVENEIRENLSPCDP